MMRVSPGLLNQDLLIPLVAEFGVVTLSSFKESKHKRLRVLFCTSNTRPIARND